MKHDTTAISTVDIGPPAPSSARRRRLLVGGLVLAMLVGYLVVSEGSGSSSVTAGEDCPADLGDCSGLPSTTVPDLTPSTTVPDVTTTTVALPGSVLTATSGTLRLEVELEPPELLTAQILRIRVKASDVPGSYIVGGSDYGDGVGGGRPQPPVLECLPPAERPATPPPAERTWTLTHAYRLPGVYTLRVEVASARCGDQDGTENHGDLKATVRAVVNVGKGLELANGPIVPVVELVQRTAVQDPGAVLLNVGTMDSDGWIERVDLDWGDNSAHHVIERPRASCVDPLKRWPGPTEVIEAPTHRYPQAGTYTARATVTSVACDGSNAQTVTETVQVSAP